ncbi:ArfGap-domain-containing protein [Leucogyrophana mollusca]|uniref:ArfGap-domain-containing protein n=1 Tax=Leucogyrophana mollusca TaxID=85980 RepID=A0ACB8BV06_9AGAM|nr:ArfGap-domain-containing protein [Leucogyrophana mollusca]
MSTGISKIAAERNHRTLLELSMKPGNDICADCKSRTPRWASYSLGIFICVHCASVHRKLGTHISKVKSVTLDQWSKEQVEVMKQNGNVKSNLYYNPDEVRHPPPTNMVDSERDSELEKFIRGKYEFKRFVDRSASRLAPPVRSSSSNVSFRPRSTPIPEDASTQGQPPPPPEKPTPSTLGRGSLYPSRSIPSNLAQSGSSSRSVSQPVPPPTGAQLSQTPLAKPPGQVWDDLVSLQTASQSSSLPLQYQPQTVVPSLSTQPLSVPQSQPSISIPANPYANPAITPGSSFPNTGQMSSPMTISPVTGVGFGSGMPIGAPMPGAASMPNASFQPSQSLNAFPSSPGGMPFGGTPQFTQQPQFQPSLPSPIAQGSPYFQPQPLQQYSQSPQIPQQQFSHSPQIPPQQYSPQPSFTPQTPYVAQQQQMYAPNQYGTWQQQGQQGRF